MYRPSIYPYVFTRACPQPEQALFWAIQVTDSGIDPNTCRDFIRAYTGTGNKNQTAKNAAGQLVNLCQQR
ncbi:hypothetical protein GCM10027098_01000 [Bowmanella dokdonensis]